jgi:hypothetical protein
MPVLEEKHMNESLGKSLGTFLDERLSNPIVSSFILSWCGWNYKFFVALFSNNTVSETLRIIDRVLYPNWMYYAFPGFLLPVGSVVLYLWLVPIFTKKYFEWTAKARKAQDEAMYEAEKHKRLSPSDSAALQDTVRRTQSELDTQTTKVERLKGDLRTAADQGTRWQESIGNLQSELQSAKTDAQSLRNTLADQIAAETKIRKERNTNALTKAFQVAKTLSEREIIALTAIADSDSGVVAASSTDTAMPDLDRTEASSALTDLAEKGLVTHGLDSPIGIVYSITQAGLDALMNRTALDAVNTASFMQAARGLTDLEARILEAAAASPVGSVAIAGLETHTPGYDGVQVALVLEQMVKRNYVEIRRDIPGGAVFISNTGKAIHEARKLLKQ